VFSLEGRAWQKPEQSHLTGMALAHCIQGKFLGVVCRCFPTQVMYTIGKLNDNEISLNFWYMYPMLWFTLYSLLNYVSCDLNMTQCNGRNMSLNKDNKLRYLCSDSQEPLFNLSFVTTNNNARNSNNCQTVTSPFCFDRVNIIFFYLS